MSQRGRSNRHSNNMNQNNYQMDVFGRRDPFGQMNQIMKGFGGFGGSLFNDPFFKNDSMMMRPFQDPFENMMNFSNMHQKAHQGGKNGTFVSQTFVSSSTIGPDGKVNKQAYYENNAGQHRNGETISQKQQAYKNNNGVNRIAQQRMLNDRGHKIIKQKRGNDIQQTNHYFNMDEDEVHNFHNSWGNTNKQMKFLQNHSKNMQSLQNGRHEQPRQLGLGYEPMRQDSRIQQTNNNPRSSQYQKQKRDNYSTKGSQRGSQVPSTRGSRKY